MQENVPPSQHEGLQSVKLSKVQELLFPQNHPGFGILSNSLAASLHMAGATLTNRLEAHKREPIDV